MRRRLHHAFQREGFRITPEEWTLLSRLWNRDGQSQRELADGTSRDRTTVTRLIDGMVGKGMVERTPDPADRRIARAWLTPAGRRLKRKVVRVADASFREGARGVDRADLDVTLRTLQQIHNNLKS